MSRFYTRTHEWVQFCEDGTALVGVTEYLVQKQKSPSFINLCDEGDYLLAGDNAGDIEFLKGVYDIHAPVSGEVLAVNDDLLLCPEHLREEPECWLLRLQDIERKRNLLTEQEYKAYLDEKEKRNG